MEYITEPVSPARLTGFVRSEIQGGMPFAGVMGEGTEPPVTTPPGGVGTPLPNLFPITPVNDIEYEFETSDFTGQGEVARYRSWDVPPDIGKRPGVTVISGEIVPLSWAYRLNEKDLKRFSAVRAANAANSQEADLVAGSMQSLARRAAQSVQNRLTLAHASLLTTGAMSYDDLGNPVSGNALSTTFPVPGGHFVTANTLWSDTANADPAANLLAAEATYADNNNGDVPDEWWISPTVAGNLLASTKLLNNLVLTVGTSNLASIPNIDMVNQVLRVKGVQAPLRVLNPRRPARAGGAIASLLATRKVLGVKAGMGKTLFSRTVAEDMMAATGALPQGSFPPGIVCYGLENISPPEVLVNAEAISVPILSNPNALYVLTV